MRFDASQQMRLSQQMKLAPRMIQSMEILQMPLLALQERIEQELESNIALEAWEPTGNREELERQREEQERAAREGERELRVDETSGAEDFERLDSFERDNPELAENEYSASVRDMEPEWRPPARVRSDGERDAKMDAMANTAARGESLEEQLLEQWSLADVEEPLREPGRLLIQWIDADGYLRTDLARIAAESPVRGGPVDVPTLERALVEVQHRLDPPGIGARDVRECLLLQIDALAEDEPESAEEWRIPRTLIADHLDDLIHNRIPRVVERSGLTVEQIREGMEQMKRLSLHPGRRLVEEAPQTIIPDAIVEYHEESDEYVAYLAERALPNLRVNREYALMAKSKDVAKPDREFIRTNLSNAQWLIDAVGQRRQTLLRVLKAVVSSQRDVFDYGWEALKPLPMTQVADQLGIHVATVSRAVAGKYVQTPRGVFPLRRFFTGGTQNDAGEDVSWDAIKAAMREVVDAEDKKEPLSDDAIVKALKEKGIEIARRTVAKYRGQLNIPPARLRKQF